MRTAHFRTLPALGAAASLAFAPCVWSGQLISERAQDGGTALHYYMRHKGQTARPAPASHREPSDTRGKSASAYDDLVRRIASTVRIDPALVKAVMHAESAFDANAVSHKGASGLMQLMPPTARRYGVRHVFKPDENILGGTRYLSDLLATFNGDTRLALAAYNAGEGAVFAARDVPAFAETRNYVSKVLGLHERYRHDFLSESRYFRYREPRRRDLRIVNERSDVGALRGPAPGPKGR